jgi:HSP20 family molecular chaperone IbpA
MKNYYSLVPRVGGKGLIDQIDTNSLFDNLWGSFDEIFGDRRYKNDDGNLVYEVDCPGFNKENLSVEIADGILTVQGKLGEGSRSREIFKRLTVGVTEDVSAEIADGVLTLTFKTPEKKKTKLTIK